MTYMGHDYYPEWLDNLADDVTLEAAAMDGTAQGSEDVRSIVVTAKELHEHQEFKFAGPVGDHGFLEDYTTQVRGEHISVIVAVAFNAAGQTQHVVVNHRATQANVRTTAVEHLDTLAGILLVLAVHARKQLFRR
jgi:hypothetical protein